MRRIAILFLLFIMPISVIFAQEYNYNYDKITSNEVSMKTYKPDTTASAVTIYKNVIAKYEYKKDAFIIEYNYENKIKILKSEGVKYANIVIPIYDKDKSDASKEFVSKIEAYAYNMEDGKIKKTKMDKSYIFEERVNPYWKQVKFSIPAVKEGTVIEYRYKLTSEFPDRSLFLRKSLPVAVE